MQKGGEALLHLFSFAIFARLQTPFDLSLDYTPHLRLQPLNPIFEIRLLRLLIGGEGSGPTIHRSVQPRETASQFVH